MRLGAAYDPRMRCAAPLTSLLALLLSSAAPANEVATTKAALPALASPATIVLDGSDVPTIEAENIADLVRAEGWIHARERFLQMDLARRQAAGELGQVVPAGVAMDRRTRPLGLRAVAERALAAMPAGQRELLDRYAEGVNAQLAAGAPLEYRMLRQEPARWRAEDTLLVELGMALFLDSSAEADRSRTGLAQTVEPSVARFLMSSAGALSMSIDGSALPAAPSLPSARELDLRTRAPRAADSPTAPPEAKPGSNAFAVAAARTKHGRAIVGNDMHLALTAPGIWYRVSLRWPGHQLDGLSLPGVPLIIQGTNGSVAWAFTNLTADLADLILVEPDPKDATRYLIEGGSEPFAVEEVRIGTPPRDELLTIRSTRWGPIVGEGPGGTPVALRWTFHEKGAIDCGLFGLAFAGTLDAALDAARDWRGPPQNILVASKDGRIGWTIAGSLPDRARPTPTIVPWRQAPEWRGILPPARKPRIVDPASGILTSGNQLAVAPTGALAAVLGIDEASGDRAFRLRRVLETRSDWTEAELHAVQLDTYSPRLVRWRDALVGLAPAESDDATTDRARSLIAGWDGFVDADESAPEIIDACRRELRKAVAACIGSDAASGISDEALLRMLESGEAHLAPAADGSWRTAASRVVAAAARSTKVEQAAARGKPEGSRDDARVDLRDDARAATETPPGSQAGYRTRGSANVAVIRHPAADALGAAARMAEMPRAPLPGHPTCVRVQTPTFGASQRSVISPNHLADAIMVTPCGQAGLPTSPHFRSLHSFWEKGEPYPLLPQDAARRVLLVREVPPEPKKDIERPPLPSRSSLGEPGTGKD